MWHLSDKHPMLVAPSAMGKSTILDEEEIKAKEAAGEIIIKTAPTSAGNIYGTIAESYSTELCLLDTLSYSVSEWNDPERGREMAKSLLGHMLIGDIWS